MEESILKISSLIIEAGRKNVLRKAVLSKPTDKSLIKTVISIKLISGKPSLQAEFFHKDNKVTHKNLVLSEIDTPILSELLEGYMQINLLCNGAECEYKRSQSGKSVLLGEKKVIRLLDSTQETVMPEESNDRKKRHVLSGNEPFLKLLGVADQNGRVYDKKQSKFRQINRFLEIIQDSEDKLPKESIRICDLCCGKSYLSFAAYHYFSVVKRMDVSMTGIDLKPDVVEHCSSVAKQLGFHGLEFICMDINDYSPEVLPSLVISLHACDIATDIVLKKAAEWKTDLILSTPCCHHELNHNIDCEVLSFITDYSMLRQKLCDAATDALRLCRLEALGYSTSTVELIDPNETPKNVLLRAVRRKHFDPDSAEAKAAAERYRRAKEFLCGGKNTDGLHF